MQRLVGNDLVQVKGAEMLQKLINEESQVGVAHTDSLEKRCVEHNRA